MRGETNELRFGGENEILREKGKTPPFLLKLEEPGDNSLRIRIAAPMDGEAGTGIDPAADSWNVPGLREMLEKSYRLVLGGFSKKKQRELLEGEKKDAV